MFKRNNIFHNEVIEYTCRRKYGIYSSGRTMWLFIWISVDLTCYCMEVVAEDLHINDQTGSF